MSLEDAPVNTHRLVAVDRMCGTSEADTQELLHMWTRTREYLLGLRWVVSIQEGFVALGIPAVLGVFLVHIRPSSADADTWVWVVIGDVPPAYLSPLYCHDLEEALTGYVGDMQAWVDAVKQESSVEDLIPVNAPPTRECALELERRLRFIESDILPYVGTEKVAPLSRPDPSELLPE